MRVASVLLMAVAVMHRVEAYSSSRRRRAAPPPTRWPTRTPTRRPTHTPSRAPTAAPTASPTAVPTAAPTAVPTASPTAVPTEAPALLVPVDVPDAATGGSDEASATWIPIVVAVLLLSCCLCLALGCAWYRRARASGTPTARKTALENPRYDVPDAAAIISTADLKTQFAAGAAGNNVGAVANPTYGAEPTQGSAEGYLDMIEESGSSPAHSAVQTDYAAAKPYVYENAVVRECADASEDYEHEQGSSAQGLQLVAGGGSAPPLPPKTLATASAFNNHYERPVDEPQLPPKPSASNGTIANVTYHSIDNDDIPPLPTKLSASKNGYEDDEDLPPPLPEKKGSDV